MVQHTETLTPPTHKPFSSYPLPSPLVPPSPDPPSVCEESRWHPHPVWLYLLVKWWFPIILKAINLWSSPCSSVLFHHLWSFWGKRVEVDVWCWKNPNRCYWECEGWVCDRESIFSPSILRLTQIVVVLSRMLTTLELTWELKSVQSKVCLTLYGQIWTPKESQKGDPISKKILDLVHRETDESPENKIRPNSQCFSETS
jgi:hypothetical protein